MLLGLPFYGHCLPSANTYRRVEQDPGISGSLLYQGSVEFRLVILTIQKLTHLLARKLTPTT